VPAHMPGIVVYSQQGYRVRNDFAGPNEDADWKEPVNTTWLQVPNENFRVRFLVQLLARPVNPFTAYFDLYYSHNGGPFTFIDNADEVFTTDSIIHAIDSNVVEYVEFENTTPLIPGVEPYLVGDNFGIVERTAFTPTSLWPPRADGNNTECEFEFCLTLRDEFVSNDDTITLRVFFNDFAFIGGYPQEATFTVKKGVARGNISTTSARFTDNLELEHTVALGADGALIVLLGASDALTPGTFIPVPSIGDFTTTVTWSGQLMTCTGSVQANAPREDPYIAAYILAGAIVSGTSIVSVNIDAEINDLFVAVIDYNSVDQSDPVLGLAISSTADPNFQLGGAGLLPTATGRGITACLCPESNGLHVGGSGQVEMFNEQEGNSSFSGFDKVIPGSGYFPMTVTNIADYTSVSLSVALRPA